MASNDFSTLFAVGERKHLLFAVGERKHSLFAVGERKHSLFAVGEWKQFIQEHVNYRKTVTPSSKQSKPIQLWRRRDNNQQIQ